TFQHNEGAAVRITGSTKTEVINNSFYDPEDLIIRGPDAPGPQAPVVTQASISPAQSHIKGTLHGPANHHFRVEVYANNYGYYLLGPNVSLLNSDKTATNPRIFVTSADVTTDANGNATFDISGGPIYGDATFSALATDLDTSETSPFSNEVTGIRTGGSID